MAAFNIPKSAELPLREIARWRPGAHPLHTPGKLDLIAERIIAAADWDFDQPARLLDRNMQAGWAQDDQRRAFVAAFVLGLPERLAPVGLPPSILDLYPAAVVRVAGELIQGGVYEPDHYAKDVRFALGLTVPAGGQIADVAYSLTAPARLGRLKRAAANGLRLAAAGDWGALPAYLRAHPAAPFVQMHTEARDLSNFSAEGWDRAYVRAADLVARFPAYGGMIGLSWFYDPAVAEVSPRLGYLAQRQVDNGAIRIRLGASPLQVELATSKSESRRRLFEEGRYKPRCYALLWPRPALLAWADSVRPALMIEPAPRHAA